jgi:hypothetical protein
MSPYWVYLEYALVLLVLSGRLLGSMPETTTTSVLEPAAATPVSSLLFVLVA